MLVWLYFLCLQFCYVCFLSLILRVLIYITKIHHMKDKRIKRREKNPNQRQVFDLKGLVVRPATLKLEYVYKVEFRTCG